MLNVSGVVLKTIIIIIITKKTPLTLNLTPNLMITPFITKVNINRMGIH